MRACFCRKCTDAVLRVQRAEFLAEVQQQQIHSDDSGVAESSAPLRLATKTKGSHSEQNRLCQLNALCDVSRPSVLVTGQRTSAWTLLH